MQQFLPNDLVEVRRLYYLLPMIRILQTMGVLSVAIMLYSTLMRDLAAWRIAAGWALSLIVVTISGYFEFLIRRRILDLRTTFYRVDGLEFDTLEQARAYIQKTRLQK